MLTICGDHSLGSTLECEDDLLINWIVDENFSLLLWAWIISLCVLVGDLLPVFVVESNINSTESLHEFIGGEEEYTVIGFDRSYLLSEFRSPSLIIITPGTSVCLSTPRISHLIDFFASKLISAEKGVRMWNLQAKLGIIGTSTHDVLFLVPFDDFFPNLIRSPATFLEEVNTAYWHTSKLSVSITNLRGSELKVVDVELGHSLLKESIPPRATLAFLSRNRVSVLADRKRVIKID